MKFVLVAVNAKFIHSAAAVYSLSAYAAAQGAPPVAVREFTINRDENDIAAALYRMKPDAVFFSCYIWNIRVIRRVAQTLKTVLPMVQIVFGGPEASYDHDELLDVADIIVVGEGERTFVSLLRHMEENKPALSEIRGIAYQEDGAVRFTGYAEPLALQELPFIYDEGRIEELGNRIVYYEASRGCPFQCRYCLSSVEKGVRQLPSSRVFEDLKFFLRYKVRQVKFIDRTFNCNPSRALEICRFLMENDNGVTNFHFEVAAELMNAPLVECFCTARKGLFQLEIGVQSTNAPTLSAVRRQNDFAMLSSVVQTIRAAGRTNLHLDLIAGLPEESYAVFARSFNDVYALLPDQLQLGFLKLLKGSGLREDAEKYGIVCAPDAPYEVLYTAVLSHDEVLRLKDIENVLDMFYNSGHFARTVACLVGLFDSPFAFYEALADFWVAKGYHDFAHSRTQMYTRLRAFCEEVCPEALAQVTDFLLYDMLSVDNAVLAGWMQVCEPEAALARRFFAQVPIERYAPHLAKFSSNRLHRMCRLVRLAHDADTGAAGETYYLFDYGAPDGVLSYNVTRDVRGIAEGGAV